MLRKQGSLKMLPLVTDCVSFLPLSDLGLFAGPFVTLVG